MNRILIQIATVCLVLLTLGWFPSCAAQSQFVSFYNSTDCEGSAFMNFMPRSGSHSWTITNNSKPLRSVEMQGLWLFRIVSEASNYTAIHLSYSRECNNGIQLSNGTIYFNSYGDAAMNDSSSISLYKQINLGGNETIITSNSSNAGFGFKSYYFTGSGSSWMTFPENDYRGTGTCIGPTSRVKRQGWGHTYVSSNYLSISSIQRVSSCPTTPTPSVAGISLGNISGILVLAISSRMF